MQAPLSSLLLARRAAACALFGALALGCGPTCGEGTALVDGVCVAALRDGGALDDASVRDAAVVVPPDGSIDAGGMTDAGDVSIRDVEIRVRYPYTSANDSDPDVPVGGVVEFEARGLTEDAEWIALPASVFRTEGDAIVGRPRASTSSMAEGFRVVGQAEGRGRVIASVESASGLREAEVFVYVDAVPLALECATHQDGSDGSRALASLEREVTLAVDLAARVSCQLAWTRTVGDHDVTLRPEVLPEDVAVATTGGLGSVDGALVRSAAVGTVELEVTYQPVATSLDGPVAMTRAHFVAEAPLEGIELGYEYVPGRVSTTALGTEPVAPPQDQHSNRYLEPGGRAPLPLVTWHRVSDTARYFREVPPAARTVRWVGSHEVATLDGADLVWARPGVRGLWLGAEGYVLPVVVASRYPAETSVTLRVAPSSLAFAPPMRGRDCETFEVFVTVGAEPERALDDMEARALVVADQSSHLWIEGPREWCVDSASRFVDDPNVTTGEVFVNWIQAPFDFTRSARVPITVSWP